MTARGLTEFLRFAVDRIPPFRETNDKVTGFQDAAVLYSVIDDAVAAGARVCGILSDDKVFSQIDHSTERAGVILRHFRNVEDLWNLLADEIKPHVPESWNDQRAGIEKAFERQLPHVRQFIADNVTPQIVSYRATKIESIGNVKMGVVDVPLPSFPP